MRREWGRFTYDDFRTWRAGQREVSFSTAARHWTNIPNWLLSQWMLEYEEEQRDNLSHGG